MANLFGKNKLRSAAQQIDTASIIGYVEIIRRWHADYHHGSLKTDKETSREQQYNRDFFLDILGYQEKPSSVFSFEPKATTDKGQLPDAVISHTDPAQNIRNIAAVVELKGASIDLDRPQRRDGNLSPVQQGFKYKTQYRSVPFVIVSNFWEFRLYYDNLLDYEAWTLDDLVNPGDDYVLFKSWYVLLSKANFTTTKGLSKTQDILSDIRIEQEDISKKFYQVYREARLDLLRDIYRRNPSIRENIDLGIEKTQKIIDRIVFAAFAQDRGLLPDNILQRVIASADNSVFDNSLWNTLKGFFEAIDKGSEKLEIPGGYNGGLFRYDPVLDVLEIDDKPLRRVAELGSYNFAEDLSVNILGHIFEQSISDLEEIKDKVNESNSLAALGLSRRKKDGIFYTPDYIVRYIVDNSLGTYLRKHEENFKIEFGLKGDIMDKTYEKREKQAYAKYQDFLQNIRVLDPACGSGAFLVYVFDYLLAENKRVGDILGNSLFSTDTWVRHILRNNIYGVDLNEESVEITKLSLWLKTAQKGKKLTALDEHIKCGNSLIDDLAIAGNKAFNWQEQFADVFQDGGFDVVVGNPPWVFTREGGFSAESKVFINNYIESKNITTESRGLNVQKGKINLYAVFIARGLDVIKPSGTLSYIIPNSILRATPYEAFRKYLLDNYMIEQIADLGAGVFEGVTASSVILVISKPRVNAEATTTSIIKDISDPSEIAVLDQRIFSRNASYVFNILANADDISLTAKLSGHGTLGDIATYISPGIDGDKSKYVSSRQLNSQYKPLLFGKSFGRYSMNFGGNYILYDRTKLNRARREEIFTSNKLVIQRVSGGLTPLKCTIDTDSYYTFNSVNNVVLKEQSEVSLHYTLGLLNSRLLNWYYATNFSNRSSLTVNISKTFLEKLPIAIGAPEDQAQLEQLVRQILQLTQERRELLARAQSVIMAEFSLSKWPTKLNRWWMLDFAGFASHLGTRLSLTQKDELAQLFDKYRASLTLLGTRIEHTDREIDETVYRIYNLTSDERAVVENP